MPLRTTDTSITDAAARRFLQDATERDTLWCERITGLHLIKLKKGGSWRYRYSNTTGKRRVATVGNYPAMKPQQAAEKALAWRNDGVEVLETKEQKREAAKAQITQAASRTLIAYLEGPYTKYQDRRKSGQQTLSMIRHNFPDLLERDMATLTRADIQAWQEKREADGRAHSTLQRAYGALTTLLRHATKQEPPILEKNPLENVSLERPRDSAKAKQVAQKRTAARRLLTPKEIAGLHTGLETFAEEIRQQRRNSRKHGKPHLPDLDAVPFPHWFIPFCYCALYTGMRTGDLYSLTWQELNVNFGRIVKVPEKTQHHPSPAQIVMDIPDALQTIMKDWWAQQGKPADGLVFASPVTGRQMDKKAHGKSWAKVKKLGKLPAELAFYALRHHFISTLVANGVPLLTVARLAGHKSVSMIEDNYGHLCPTAAADALAMFSATVERREKV